MDQLRKPGSCQDLDGTPDAGVGDRAVEVKAEMTPALQGRVVEIHPEVSFWALTSGRPMAHPKGTPEGLEERRGLLASALDTAIPTQEEARSLARPAARDDVLDAIVAAWSARRWAEGAAGRLPTDPSVDARGLRMEIVY